ncbi:MAG: choice-of-anchor C family protein [Verrucomicrobiota bacterium]|jgi:choice-of-anchor C domain-containing protein
MKSLKSIVAASTVGTMLLLPGSASANLVLDGGFEQGAVSGPFQTYTAVSTMGGWTVTAGSVDLIGNYWQPAQGSQSVDMAGFYANGTIQQPINGLTAGAWYYFTFDMSGNPDGPPTIKTLDVTFGNTTQVFTFDTTGISHANMGWVLDSGWFQASGSSTVLSFTDASAPLADGSPTAFGAVIDNVSLNAVPEPTTIIAGALLLLPFGASTLRILRKNRTA